MSADLHAATRDERRLMFVHAHPDDEASKGAATAARYLDDGAEVTLVTCTGGEAGDLLNPSAGDARPDDMGAIRARELEASVAAIGFTRNHVLGYVDSGYHMDPADVPDGTFARTPIDEPSRLVAGLIRRERPQVVVTYPEDGGYPHPDHIMNHLVTVRGLELAEDPEVALDDVPGGDAEPWRVPKVYASTAFPPERLRAIHQGLLDAGLESPYTEWLEQRRDERDPGPDPDTRIWCPEHFERRDAALRAHVTQIDPDGFWFGTPRDLERVLYPYEGYLLLRSDVLVNTPEADLFAGLDLPLLPPAPGTDPADADGQATPVGSDNAPAVGR
ncbi:MAG: mycothiol conjugate amidase Mca [Nitriliruptoraceae bacterium]|nr:mycothiol conjugate amidase Mca [Nitriliruptoraceae bacterium]